MNMKERGLVACSTRSPDLNPLNFFLWSCMKSRVYDGGKSEGRHQLVEAIHEAVLGISKELGCMQWQHLIAQRLATCILRDRGISNMCCNNLENYVLL
jgi:hypothetical protein